jgi:hypothetical protein
MGKNKIASILVMCLLLGSLAASAKPKEPERPAVNHRFDATKEATIERLSHLSPGEAFGRLKGSDFLVDTAMLHKGIFTAFEGRTAEAVELALDHVKLPLVKVVDGKPTTRTDDFYVAKKILQVFPDEAFDSLLELYANSPPPIRANVIRVLGEMAGNQEIKSVLINALDDTSLCERKHLEESGIPLRICDVAYNQLVLRYEIKGVLRTIGTVHTIEQREYHIDVLRNLLASM